MIFVVTLITPDLVVGTRCRTFGPYSSATDAEKARRRIYFDAGLKRLTMPRVRTYVTAVESESES